VSKTRKIGIIPLTCLLCYLLSFGGRVSANTVKLAIVYSDSLKTTIRTIKGIKSTVDRHYESTVYYEYLLTSNLSQIEKQIDELRQNNPRLILTVGSFATKIVSERIKNKPVIFSAVLNPETSGFVESLRRPGGNITGASLDIPPDIQFKYFKRVIRSLKRVGVLYTEETANLIPPAQALAREAGLELHAIKVNSEKEIPAALDSLSRYVDALWSVADANIYSPRSTRYILLKTLRNGIPFMGFSRNLVESGALFALDYDYKDIGRQAGKIALRVLSGKSPAAIPVAVPGIIWFHYNEKTASHINVKIPEELAAVAKEVYR
jgi:putative ABC transport system substrate-binding protein